MTRKERSLLAQLSRGPKKGYEFERAGATTYMTLAHLEADGLVAVERVARHHEEPQWWYTITKLGLTSLEREPPKAVALGASWLMAMSWRR